ncbi:MAG: hypothetical protein AABX31_05800 [Nanoarchaeota archaeon]
MKDEITILNKQEIRKVYKEKCADSNTAFTEKEFERFVNYLEIDFYDWIRDNLKQFETNNSK